MSPQISYESYAAIGPKVVSGKGCQLGWQRNFPWTWPCIKMLMLRSEYFGRTMLTLWGRMTHICVCNWTIIGSDNSLSPGRRQAVIWTIARILLIRPLGTNLIDILIEIHTLPFKKMHWEMSSAKWRPICFGLDVLIPWLVKHRPIASPQYHHHGIHHGGQIRLYIPW